MPSVNETDLPLVERSVHHPAVAIAGKPLAHAGVTIILSVRPAGKDILLRQTPRPIKGGDIDPDDRVRRLVLPPVGERFVLPENDVFAHRYSVACIHKARATPPLSGGERRPGP